MNKLINSDDVTGTAVFLIVVGATLASVFLGARSPYSWTETGLLLLLGLAFLVIGQVGFDRVERRPSPLSLILYFGVQIWLGTAILYISRLQGFGALLLLPIAGQAVAVLSFRGVLAVCLLVILSLTAVVAILVDWSAAAFSAVSYSTGVLFVVLFAHIAVREGKARAEVERLATELREANGKLSAYAVQAEELATIKERNRLAREIHDSLGHYLTVINVQIQAAQVVLDREPQRARDALHKAQTLTQEGLTEVRRSVAALRAAPTENKTLVEAVTALAAECRAAGILTEVHVLGSPRRLRPQIEQTLYRAVQEGLTNTRKHARASRVDITLDYQAAAVVCLRLQDNGVGAATPADGFGLIGIRERAHLLNGRFKTQTAHRQGFTLLLELPVTGAGSE
jgi:signal transduction histidine kinase